MTGANFSSSHAVAIVSFLDHVLRFEWLGEARPTRAAIKLVNRSKQRLAGHDVNVNTWFFVIPIGILKGSFRPITLRHTVLLRRKARYRFRILVVFRHRLIFLLSRSNRQLSQPVPVSLQLPSRICDSDLWFTSVKVRKRRKLKPLFFYFWLTCGKADLSPQKRDCPRFQ